MGGRITSPHSRNKKEKMGGNAGKLGVQETEDLESSTVPSPFPPSSRQGHLLTQGIGGVVGWYSGKQSSENTWQLREKWVTAPYWWEVEWGPVLRAQRRGKTINLYGTKLDHYVFLYLFIVFKEQKCRTQMAGMIQQRCIPRKQRWKDEAAGREWLRRR